VTNEGQITSTFNTDATVKGFEVELSGSAWSRLTVAAGVGYQDSTYDDYPNAPVNTQNGLAIVDLTGETLPFVPKWTSSLSAFYRIPVASAVNLNVGGDLQYRSDYRVNDGPDPRLVVEDTTLLNAEAGVRFERFGLELRVRGQNLLDRSYITSLDFNNLAGATSIDLSAPRTVFVELRKYFH
jgi:iron complex outermembrane receptor protein